MSNDQTARLDLPYLAAAQAQKHVTLNAALNRLDGLVACRALSRSLAVPPVAPAEGDAYIAPTSPTGDWAGASEGALIRRVDGAWSIEPAPEGLTALVVDEARVLVRGGGAWRPLGDWMGELQGVTRLGIGAGATADAGNPLLARLNAALFTALPSAEGGDGDIRLTLNKSGAANTASLVLQDGYSGRAEIGLAGDDKLHLKVSADGASWVTALVVTPGSGAVSLPAQPLPVSEGGTGARTGGAACAALGALPLSGGAMTGPMATAADLGLTCLASEAVFPLPSLIVNESGHAVSNRAAMIMGSNWVLGQDFNGSGVKDFFAFNQALGAPQLQLPATGGLAVNGLPVFDDAGGLMLKPTASASLPSASLAGRLLWCSDLGAAVLSDGTVWRRASGGVAVSSTDADRSLTALDAPVQVQAGALSAARSLSLPTAAAAGAGFRIVRTGGGSGSLNVGGLKTLNDQSWCEVAYDGAAWRLVGAGGL